MKKALFIFAAIIACSVYSCKKNEIELLEQPIIQNIDDNLVKYTFTAVVNDKLTDADTKASVSRAGAFSWQEGDALVFYTKNGDPATAEITKVDGSVATITVTTDNPRSDFYSAIYPAEAASAKNKVSFNARGPIVVSAVDGGTLTFYHIGSLINVKFTNIPSATQSVVFAPKTTIGYDGTFDFSDRVPSLSFGGAINEIVVPASQDDENKDITICLPSVTLTGGFSVALNVNADGAGRNLYKKSTANTHNLYTNRPVLLNMKKLAYAAPSKYYVTTESTTHYWDRSSVRMLQTSGNTYEVYMNCDGNTNIYIFDEYNVGNETNGYLNNGHVDGAGNYQITWNTSSSSGGPTYKNSTLNKPFGDDNYPTDHMCLTGSFNGWGTGNVFSYNGNMNWVLTDDLVISTTGTYEFKIRKTSGWDDQYQAGGNSGLGEYLLYGSLFKGNGNATVKLETATYTVYLNASENWYYSIMFEKQ